MSIASGEVEAEDEIDRCGRERVEREKMRTRD